MTDLIIKYLENTASDAERKELLGWLRDDIHYAEFCKIKETWMANVKKEELGRDLNEGLLSFKFFILNDLLEHTNKMKRLYKYAAVILLLILAGAVLYFGRGHNKEILLTSVFAGRGDVTSVVLPDSSRVWLNAGSTLIYPSDYGLHTRAVSLEGEGFFSVQKDKDHPFVVSANQVDVTALGTSFNVESYDRNNKVVVTLEEGSVKTVCGSDEKIQTPGTQVIVSNDKMEMIEVDTELFTAWHLGEIKFKDESLLNIAHQLERIYDVTINFASDSIKNYRYRGTIDIENPLIKTLDILQLSTNIEYEIDDKHILLIQK
ncbi:FecR family protein [Saccharicrinis fermentans]|uniref:Fec operon regulator FecR n=1 Tax=Saccharicrinis fermentans DSM 9555 = JCM 21142 TaxID=869213 RepID=W7YKG4_9BACT|nr:FecR domain-containing protein [Saccharicrinis fermentans]GAF05016.1 fec operon regulator FecR [Saccharicrinis fermentans DSM 9555 = JCM 21142]